jgi:hypothetical protein
MSDEGVPDSPGEDISVETLSELEGLREELEDLAEMLDVRLKRIEKYAANTATWTGATAAVLLALTALAFIGLLLTR